jgi:hypothetical protein
VLMAVVTCQADDGQDPLIFLKIEKLTGGRSEMEFFNLAIVDHRPDSSDKRYLQSKINLYSALVRFL